MPDKLKLFLRQKFNFLIWIVQSLDGRALRRELFTNILLCTCCATIMFTKRTLLPFQVEPVLSRYYKYAIINITEGIHFSLLPSHITTWSHFYLPKMKQQETERGGQIELAATSLDTYRKQHITGSLKKIKNLEDLVKEKDSKIDFLLSFEILKRINKERTNGDYW
ncbi:hypothetical protein ACJX0J_030777, partial [Zea mays]